VAFEACREGWYIYDKLDDAQIAHLQSPRSSLNHPVPTSQHVD
jgi:hypothetical protein